MVDGRTVRAGDSRVHLESLLGAPCRVNHFRDRAWTHDDPPPIVHEYEYHALNGELIVGFSPAKGDTVSYFILYRRPQ